MKSNAHLLPELTVSPSTPLIEAVAVLTKAGRKLILVKADDGKLLGIITDYDVRQALLNHVEFTQPVTAAMNKNPIVGKAGMNRGEVLALILKERCSQIPLLDTEGRVVDIHFQDEFLESREEESGKVAVIMAGGFGKRLRPMTEHVPKPLLTVAGRPILFLLIDQLLSEGFDTIYVTLNYKREMIEEAIKESPRYFNHVFCVLEEKPLGTAGSLSLLPEKPQSPFLVINADLLTNISLQRMLNFHADEKNIITMATRREKYTIPYGVVKLDGSRVISIEEKPNFTYFINTGVYVVNPEILSFLPKGEYCDMPSLAEQILAKNGRVGSFPVHEYWLDIGNHENYAQAQEDFLRHFSNGDEE